MVVTTGHVFTKENWNGELSLCIHCGEEFSRALYSHFCAVVIQPQPVEEIISELQAIHRETGD